MARDAGRTAQHPSGLADALSSGENSVLVGRVAGSTLIGVGPVAFHASDITGHTHCRGCRGMIFHIPVEEWFAGTLGYSNS